MCADERCCCEIVSPTARACNGNSMYCLSSHPTDLTFILSPFSKTDVDVLLRTGYPMVNYCQQFGPLWVSSLTITKQKVLQLRLRVVPMYGYIHRHLQDGLAPCLFRKLTIVSFPFHDLPSHGHLKRSTVSTMNDFLWNRPQITSRNGWLPPQHSCLSCTSGCILLGRLLLSFLGSVTGEGAQ